jgi:hypothetical protein
LKRVGVGLRVAPRPWFDSTGIPEFYGVNENITRTNELETMSRDRSGDEPSGVSHS